MHYQTEWECKSKKLWFLFERKNAENANFSQTNWIWDAQCAYRIVHEMSKIYMDFYFYFSPSLEVHCLSVLPYVLKLGSIFTKIIK